MGFQMEGCMREAVQRDGKCFDHMIMGILRDEWIDARLESTFEIIYVVCRRYNGNWRKFTVC